MKGKKTMITSLINAKLNLAVKETYADNMFGFAWPNFGFLYPEHDHGYDPAHKKRIRRSLGS